jgi:hypothetical protein
MRLTSNPGSFAAMGLALSLSASACSTTVRQPVAQTQPAMRPGVHVLSPAGMLAWCSAVDPEGACEDFQPTPEVDVVDFDERLPQLLTSKGHANLAGPIRDYVRQYWATSRHGRLYVVGNFVCRSLLLNDEDFDPEFGQSASEARVPIVVDDAGKCAVSAIFPAGRPDDVEFHTG